MNSLSEHYVQQPSPSKTKEDQGKMLVQVSIFLGLILEEFHRQKKTQQQVDINEEVRGFSAGEPAHDDEGLLQHLVEQ